MIPLGGNTCPIKDIIKSAGGVFSHGLWRVPASEYTRLAALVPPPRKPRIH